LLLLLDHGTPPCGNTKEERQITHTKGKVNPPERNALVHK
jgi:hypothetical protein